MKQYVFFGLIAIGVVLAAGIGLRFYRDAGMGPPLQLLAEVRRSAIAEPAVSTEPSAFSAPVPAQPAKKAQKKTSPQTIVKETSEAFPRAAATPSVTLSSPGPDRLVSSDAPVRAAPSFTLSIAKSGEGSGIVASVPEGIDCGSSCARAFTEGTRVTLRATADSGSWFDGWINCGGIGECAVILSRDTRITASFSRLASAAAPASFPVLISEIFYDAAGSDVGKEFIELYNRSDAEVDLTGWVVAAGDKTILKIGGGEGDQPAIPANGFFLAGFNKYAGVADTVRSASLPNALETTVAIVLKNKDGEVVEKVIYGGDLATEKDSGASLERRVWEGAASFSVQPNPNPRHSGN